MRRRKRKTNFTTPSALRMGQTNSRPEEVYQLLGEAPLVSHQTGSNEDESDTDRDDKPLTGRSSETNNGHNNKTMTSTAISMTSPRRSAGGGGSGSVPSSPNGTGPRHHLPLTMSPKHEGPTETSFSIAVQILFPFLVAGFGMVAAGIVLDIVQHWNVFKEINELFILVPALLGLKGNLEMTLASRLSTLANLGHMDNRSDAIELITSNLALIQLQGIVIGFVASLFAMIMDFIPERTFSVDHGLLLAAASVVTASIASFLLGLVMVMVILLSRRYHINPDNVATPIAASLGDLVTLALLSSIASVLYADRLQDRWLAPVIIVGYLLFTPVCFFLAKRNAATEKVLYTGWTPVLVAMTISSAGGLILDNAVAKFKGIAVFQPVFNGVGGNLVAVQASRISTYLHTHAEFGILPPGDEKVCIDPCTAIWGGSIHSRTARILLLLVLPGHLLFALTIAFVKAGHTSTTPVFFVFYLCAAVIQIWILLHTAHWLIHYMWKCSIDPDNSAIPYLTALGDLLGGGLLALSFELLFLMSDQKPEIGNM